VALESIRRAGTKDRRAIADAALAIRDFDGALGHWGFDPNGDTTMRTLTVSVVKGGRFEFETIIDATAADAPGPAAAAGGAAVPDVAR
jgi:branched-chain amino acid transport system substrate-binding protein